MKILMIGHSRSGKTSYMAGLYNLYGDDPNGFGLWMSDSTKKQALKRLGDNITKGYYPVGTDIASIYNFWLQYDNSLLIPFDWYDYRGGALSESSKTSQDANDLLRHIDTADAIIVFLDGEKIVNMTNDDLEEEYDILLWAIQKAISKRSSDGTYFPVAFVVTKGDLYQTYEPIYNSPGLQYFLPIVKSISQSSNCAGMIGIVEVSKEGISNVFAPLIFSLYYGMPHYIKDRVSSINSEIDRYNSLDPNIFDDLGTILFGGKSDRDKARESIQKIEEEKSKLETLESLSDVMEKILAHLREQNMIIQF